jgi:hypothetical protein
MISIDQTHHDTEATIMADLNTATRSGSRLSRYLLPVERPSRNQAVMRLANTIRERFGITDERLVAQAKGWGFDTRTAEQLVEETRDYMRGWNSQAA